MPGYRYYRLHESAEYLLRQYIRWKYPHVQPKWMARALWGAWHYTGSGPGAPEQLVKKARLVAGSKFRSDPDLKNPNVSLEFLDDVVANMPPMEGGFERARIQTLMITNILERDDWRVAQWVWRRGMLPQPADLRDFLPDMKTREISNRLKEQS